MEKIYMDSKEKKTKKQTFFKQLFNDRGSMIALVVVAFVGVLGLMVFGLNQISFAAPTDSLGESFISAQGDDTMARLTGETTEGVDGILPILGFYTKDTGIPIFCIEYDVTYKIGEIYKPGEPITDYGLMYLMSQMYPNKEFKNADGDEYPENVQMWLTQSAIWTYLYESEIEKNLPMSARKNSTFNSTPTSSVKYYADNIRKVNKLYRQGTSGVEYVVQESTPLYEKLGINSMISLAKKIKKDPTSFIGINKKSNNISVTNDNKYYQSDLISVVASTTFGLENQTLENKLASDGFKPKYNGYSVSLSNAPEGTILVDEKGNKYDDIKNMSPTDKFFVRVPIKNVTDENKKFSLSINGKFEMYGANKYVSGNYQKVANVKLRAEEKSNEVQIDLDYTPDVPDTGMGVAQTIYFMGLILLLSGVGIVYANAKPKTNE